MAGSRAASSRPLDNAKKRPQRRGGELGPLWGRASEGDGTISDVGLQSAAATNFCVRVAIESASGQTKRPQRGGALRPLGAALCRTLQAQWTKHNGATLARSPFTPGAAFRINPFGVDNLGG